MNIITISNLKGGVGKTTSVVNLAYSFFSMGKKVLVIDLDPQCNTTGFFAKVNKSGYTIKEVFEGKIGIKRAIYRTKYRGIDVVRGNVMLSEKGDVFHLSAALQEVAERYDICMIDTRPSFERLTVSALYAADLVLTPVKMDNFSRDNLALVEDYIEEVRESNTGMGWRAFATMVSKTKAQRKVMADLAEKHDYPFCENCITRTADIDNALVYYKPVALHKRRSAATADYMDLAEEIWTTLECRKVVS